MVQEFNGLHRGINQVNEKVHGENSAIMPFPIQGIQSLRSPVNQAEHNVFLTYNIKTIQLNKFSIAFYKKDVEIL